MNALADITATRVFVIALALFIVLGAFTPIACSLAVFVGLFSLKGHSLPTFFPALLHLMTTLSLMMLGPGAYSVDARLFGRRLIVPPRQCSPTNKTS